MSCHLLSRACACLVRVLCVSCACLVRVLCVSRSSCFCLCCYVQIARLGETGSWRLATARTAVFIPHRRVPPSSLHGVKLNPLYPMIDRLRIYPSHLNAKVCKGA